MSSTGSSIYRFVICFSFRASAFTKFQPSFVREASLIAPKSLEAQIIQDASHPIEALKEAISTSITDLPTQAPSPLSDINPATPTSPIRRLLSMTKAKGAKIPWKDPEPWEVLRAVENKDVIYLMEVRDRAFHALVCPSGGLTPLIHAMHIGKSHHDVAITLGKDFAKKEIKSILVSIRGSLKVAIDYGLQSSQIDLLASFMQTLVMSEGDHWIQEQLKLGPSACPVEVARTSIKRIATHALNKAPLIAELEDYISNATLDLLMMAAWSLALESFHGEPIPPYSFARDDRVYRAFTERLDKYRDHINRRLRKQLKSQLETLRTIIQGRARSWHVSASLLF
ncbi:hypothetical protein F5148DRAFT_1273809 [Russula earlei]|uniref:Uncharacterized protein n=1 Tax=Russula earlei TaxID=71964 RepID=A0ACC0UKT5_9AGAM|nr:hypothetical protein F5148DRAFT_1273809 [Russula earlei]